ncbi:hypothetical protein [Micromonospora phaseoli]|uniref:hypothetical protein n=1 Tax=Micromonospora phaseoli TaxID=1144548 RepID=UPI000B242EEB|nr:hypothetical protein [Micromonospora phaseoli]GIJ79084.1 hypothetical protein Xph01_35160 [Micromonospora phaseoli]
MIWIDGHQYGTAAEIADLLGADISAARVRDWARRAADPDDPLYGLLTRYHVPGRGRGTTWYRCDEAASVERTTRLTKGGPARVVCKWKYTSEPG